MAGESDKLKYKNMFFLFIKTQHKQYEHNIEWPPSSYMKFS